VTVLTTVTVACGSSTVSTTTGGPAGSTDATLPADLDASCAHQYWTFGTEIDLAGNGGAGTPKEALGVFLASPEGAKVRGEDFVPALRPSSDQPVQSVGAGPVSSTSIPPAVSATTGPPPQWWVHVDDQGRVTAVVTIAWAGGWSVTSLEGCLSTGGTMEPTMTTFAYPTKTAGSMSP